MPSNRKCRRAAGG